MFAFGLDITDIRRILWSALFAFIGAYATIAAGFQGLHNFEEGKAAVLALLPAAIAAALSAIKNGILSAESGLK